jgi:hypothetical protein
MSPTPILDREQLPPALPKRKRWLPLVVGGLIGVAIAGDAFRPLDVIALMVPVLFLGILVHELGHAAAGLLAGFEFRRLVVGPLAFTREARRYRLRFMGKRFLAGGYTMMLPPSPEGLRRGWLLFGAGGPIATLLLFGLVPFLPWRLLAEALLMANLILAASSWIPWENRGHYTDAKLIQILLRKGPEAERFSAVLYLVTLDGQGIPPRDWSPEVVAKLSRDGGRNFAASARMLLHIHARNSAPAAEVAAALEQVLAISDQMSGSQRLAYFAEAAYFQAVNNRNAELARDWLADARAVKGAIAQKGWDESAMAAIAYAEGNEKEFEAHRAHALEYLDRQPGPSGSVEALRARLVGLSLTAPAPSTHQPKS